MLNTKLDQLAFADRSDSSGLPNEIAQLYMRQLFKALDTSRSPAEELENQVSRGLTDFFQLTGVSSDAPIELLAEGFKETTIPEDPSLVADYVDYLFDDVVAHCVHVPS